MIFVSFFASFLTIYCFGFGPVTSSIIVFKKDVTVNFTNIGLPWNYVKVGFGFSDYHGTM